MDCLQFTLFPTKDKQYVFDCVENYKKRPNKTNFYKAFIACCSYGMGKYNLKTSSVDVFFTDCKYSFFSEGEIYIQITEMKKALKNPDKFYNLLTIFFHEFTHYYISRNNERYLLGKANRYYWSVCKNFDLVLDDCFGKYKVLVDMTKNLYYINNQNEYWARKFGYHFASKICKEFGFKVNENSFLDSERKFIRVFYSILLFIKSDHKRLENIVERYQLNFIENIEEKSDSQLKGFFELLSYQQSQKVHDALVKKITTSKNDKQMLQIISQPVVNFTKDEYDYIKMCFQYYDFSKIDKQKQKTKWECCPPRYIMMETLEKVVKFDEQQASELSQ